ncbi:hypothetical protein [Streptomyces sp. bgisy022]|uniref:hypothetical protein n=1 Tax=Streptomyces sp. bgisy022 TaxID=3413769 RepID=UPI003D750370
MPGVPRTRNWRSVRKALPWCGRLRHPAPLQTELSRTLGTEHAVFGFTPFPAVADAAAFGIPQDDRGEEVKAVVEPAPGHEPGPARAAASLDLPRP